jgi:hypothetical protein
MRKGVFIIPSVFLFLLNMISAYSYNSVSIVDFFETLGGENIALAAIFLISFALLFTILGRTGFFKENNAAAVVISLSLSLLISYGLYRQNIDFNIDGIIFSLGISDMAMDLLVFFGTVGLLLLILIKFKANTFLIIGGILFALSVFGIINDGGITLAIGIVMIVIWGAIKFFRRRLRISSRVKVVK